MCTANGEAHGIRYGYEDNYEQGRGFGYGYGKAHGAGYADMDVNSGDCDEVAHIVGYRRNAQGGGLRRKLQRGPIRLLTVLVMLKGLIDPISFFDLSICFLTI